MIKKLGFSLLEMIIVISLMGIIARSITPLLDTKTVKQDAVKSLAQEVFTVQEALLNYYIDSNGSSVPQFPTTITELQNEGYLSYDPRNIFFSDTVRFPDEWVINPILKNVNGYNKHIGVGVRFSVPTKYLNMIRMYLPQVRDISRIVPPPMLDVSYVEAYLPSPGSEASHDNLLHRDSGAVQELRTMHGALGIVDNLDGSNSKIVISNTVPNPGDPLINPINGYGTGTGTIVGPATGVGSLTIGMLETNMTGIRGVSPTTSNLVIDAFNPNKAGGERGHVVIGSYESEGVVLGAFDEANNAVKSRVLVDKDGTYFASYDYPVGGTPQWISKIDNQGQTWNNKSDHNEVTARIDANQGHIAAREIVGVIGRPDGGKFTWSNAQRDMELVPPAVNDKGDYAAALIETKDINNAMPDGSGALFLADDCLAGNTNCAGTPKADQYALITKEKEFYGPSFIGSILHVGQYLCGEQLDGWGNLWSGAGFNLPCAGGTGIVRPVITGTVGNFITGSTEDPIAFEWNRGQFTNTDRRNRARANQSVSAGHLNLGYKGFNRWIEDDGRVSCKIWVRDGEFLITTNTNNVRNSSTRWARCNRVYHDGDANVICDNYNGARGSIMTTVMYMCLKPF